MFDLVEEGVYKPNRMYDYQATCFQSTESGSDASRCRTVRTCSIFNTTSTNTIHLQLITNFREIFEWLKTFILVLFWNLVNGYGIYRDNDDFEIGYERIRLEHFKNFPCHKESWIYSLNYEKTRNLKMGNQSSNEQCFQYVF